MRDQTQLTSVFKRRYAPIEQQAIDAGKQGPWTDVYALAATLYQALTGSPPPDAGARLNKTPVEPPSALGVAIPPGADRALMKALALLPRQRTKDIARLRQGLTADLPRVAEPGRLRRNAGRWVLGILGTFLLGLLVNGTTEFGSRWYEAYSARQQGLREARDQRAFHAAEDADDIAGYRAYLAQCDDAVCAYKPQAEARLARLEAARRAAEAEAKRQAEEVARRAAEAEAKRQAEEVARRAAEASRGRSQTPSRGPGPPGQGPRPQLPR